MGCTEREGKSKAGLALQQCTCQIPASWDRQHLQKPGQGHHKAFQLSGAHVDWEAVLASYRESPFGDMSPPLGMWRLGRSLDSTCTPQPCSPEEARGSALPQISMHPLNSSAHTPTRKISWWKEAAGMNQ